MCPDINSLSRSSFSSDTTRQTEESREDSNTSSIANDNIQNNTDNPKGWNERIVTHRNKWDNAFDAKMPNFIVQQKIDELAIYIQGKFAPLTKFNEWLDSNGEGNWHRQLATFLVKLPLRAVRNILNLLYNIIKELFFAMSHPLKALNHLAHLIVSLIYELSKPETWSKMGVGMVGASFGQALVTGNPLSIIGLLVGSSLLVSGLSFGALKAAFNAEKSEGFSKAKAQVLSQLMQLPESFLTGFFMGLLIGGIQRAAYEKPQTQEANYEKAKQYTHETFNDPNVKIENIQVDGAGNVVVKGDLPTNWNDIRYSFQVRLTPSGMSWESYVLKIGDSTFNQTIPSELVPWSKTGIESSFREPLIVKLPQDGALNNMGFLTGVSASKI